MLPAQQLSDQFKYLNYQAVARDANGDPVANQTIGLSFQIYYGLSIAYTETQTVTTNDLGLFTAEIGAGTPGFGNFPTYESINWRGAVLNWSMSVAIDITGGTNYQGFGPPVQIRSVPFSNLAHTAEVLGDSSLYASYLSIRTREGASLGIGRDPTATLDVDGDLRITDGTEGEGSVLTSDADGRARWAKMSAESMFGQAYSGVDDGSCTSIVGGLSMSEGETQQFTMGIVADGDKAYLMEFPFLTVIDVSDPTEPIALGSVNVGSFGGPGVRLAQSGQLVHYLYSNSLQLVDVSVPTAPTIAGILALPGATAVAAKDDRSFILSSTGLQIFDVSVPASPVSLGTIALGASPRAIDVAGDLAFVVDDASNELSVIDISVPSSMSILDTYTLSGPSNYVHIDGTRAYAGGGLMEIIDISDPMALSLIGEILIGSANVVSADGNTVCTADVLSQGIKVIDVSDPSAPFIKGIFGASSPLCYGSTISVSGNFAYAAVPCSGMRVIQLNCYPAVVYDPGTGMFVPQSGPSSVFGQAPPQGIDLSCASAMSQVSLDPGQIEMAKSGGRIHLLNSSGFVQSYDVSNPEQMVQINTGIPNVGSDPKGIAAGNGYVFVIDAGTDSLKVYGTYGYPSLGLFGGLGLGSDPRAIAYEADHLFITMFNQDLLIVDVSSPATPALVGSLTLGNANPLALDIQGDKVFVLTSTLASYMHVVDWSDPTSPFLVGTPYSLQSMDARAIVIDGNFGYVMGYGTGEIRSLNIGDPLNISQLSTTTVPPLASDMSKVGNLLVVTNSISGELYLLRDGYVSLEKTLAIGSSLVNVTTSSNYAFVADATSNLVTAVRLGCSTEYSYDPNTDAFVASTPNWTDGGAGSVYNTNGGNVGIGTSTPTAKLHVTGNVRIEDGTEGAGKVLTSDADGNASWSNAPSIASGSYTTTWTNAGGFTSTPSFRTCEYTRVGGLVTVVCRFGGTGPTFSAGTNQATITVPPGLEVADPAGGRLISGTFASDHYRNGSDTEVGIVAHENNTSVRIKINGSNAGIAGSWCSFTYLTSAP